VSNPPIAGRSPADRSTLRAVRDLAMLRGVRGALFASIDDALPIDSHAHVDIDVDALAALATTLYRRACAVAAVAEGGQVGLLSLDASGGRLVAAGCGAHVLVVLAERATNPGLLRVAMRRALEEVA